MKKNKEKIVLISILIFSALFFVNKVWAVDQIKTSEFFITSSGSAVSSATTSPFAIYIGDNLSGVSNPVKSAYVLITGTYTGGGTLQVGLDSDSATYKTFSLATSPAGGALPLAFEILYKDEIGKINPTSAGQYSYTLNMTPSGVTVYNLGARAVLSHRFNPASCDDGQSSNEKIKTSEFFITSSGSAVSSATTSPFAIYIGDNLSGVSNPVKSAYVLITGTYTGGGTLQVGLDSDSATYKTFSLVTSPNGGVLPLAFEILYKDETGKINPTSAGQYSYTLNMTPSGVTVYNLGARAVLSHRYKPPSCGTGYPATGTVYSAIFDTGSTGAAYNSILWKGSLGTGNTGRVRFQLATSNSSSGPWSYVGGNSSCTSGDWFEPASPYVDTPAEIKCYAELNNKRYYRYKVQICSANNCVAGGDYTPTVDDVVVSWSP